MGNCLKGKKCHGSKFNVTGKSEDKFNKMTKAISSVIARGMTDKTKKR